jgi:histidine ammonia-lyase
MGILTGRRMPRQPSTDHVILSGELARPVVIERVAELLNAGYVPQVPRIGSLGASGDLAPSAHAFLPLLGEGRAFDPAGELVSGSQALAALGLEPLRLESKEGLALINGTHFMSAIGALVSVRVARLLDAADVVTAVTIDALRGALAAFEARVHRLRPLDGQSESAANIRSALQGSTRTAGPGSARLQDAYSLRCSAPVHGAAREGYRFFSRLVLADLNAVTDNPLVFEDPAEVISAGNFHGQSLALAFDTLRLVLADLASISERRTFRLLSPSINGRAAAGVPDHGCWSVQRLHSDPVHRGCARRRAAGARPAREHRQHLDLRQSGGSRVDGDVGGVDGAGGHRAAGDRGGRGGEAVDRRRDGGGAPACRHRLRIPRARLPVD